MRYRETLAGLGGAVLVLIMSSAVFAQKTTGDITGTISDATGAMLPGVTITAVCTETNLTRTAETNAQGGFR